VAPSTVRGRFKWKPAELKIQVLALRREPTSAPCSTRLVRHGFVRR